MLKSLAKFFEFLAYVLEDIAERIDKEAAKEEATRQWGCKRDNLVDGI